MDDWISRFTVFISIFNIAEENSKFELYTDSFDSDFSFNELKDNVAEVLGLSDISTEDLKLEIYGPNIIKT